jgi:hypothetical protein
MYSLKNEFRSGVAVCVLRMTPLTKVGEGLAHAGSKLGRRRIDVIVVDLREHRTRQHGDANRIPRLVGFIRPAHEHDHSARSIHHSYRNATIGSTFAARRAGK